MELTDDKQELLSKLEHLQKEFDKLKQEKNDLEVLLQTIIEHSDGLESELEQTAKKVLQEKDDLEILLETTTAHSDMIAAELEEDVKEATRESEMRLVQFLEAVPVGIFVVDAQSKPYYANRMALQIFGEEISSPTDDKFDRASQLAHSILENSALLQSWERWEKNNYYSTLKSDFRSVLQKDLNQLSKVYLLYLAGTDQIYPLERHPLLCALQGKHTSADDIEIHYNDRAIPLEVWATPIFDENDTVLYAIAVFQDITHRKQAEADRIRLAQECEAKNVALQMNREIEAKNQELATTLQQLRSTQYKLIESEKMASLGNLVAGVAHEINTPIGIGVTGASQLDSLTQEITGLLANKAMKRSDLEKYLNFATQISDLVLKNLNRAAELVRSFKQVAVDQSSEQQRTFNLKTYLNDIINSLQPRFKNTPYHIHIECEDGLILFSYPSAFYQIISNLIINSLVHGFAELPQGEVVINASLQEPAQTVSSAKMLVLRYTDDGKGIDAEIIEKIFEPFFTTNRQGGGSGLGLNIVYNLVTHKLKGNIHCASELGKGTVFTMEIPLS